MREGPSAVAGSGAEQPGQFQPAGLRHHRRTSARRVGPETPLLAQSGPCCFTSRRYIGHLHMTLSRSASMVCGQAARRSQAAASPRRRKLMDSYTITIAPNDDSGAGTKLVVDTSSGQVRITDVHLHAPQGLSSGHIPTVDFDLLLQAVTGTVTASNGQDVATADALNASHDTPALGAASTIEPAGPPVTPATPKRRARKTASRAAATPTPRPARARAAAAATSTTRNTKQPPAKAATKKTPPTPASKQTATRAIAPAKRRTPTKRTRAATTAAAPATSGRVYRRTPEDLAAVFERFGTVAAIAEHYQVPRYTAQGWVSRLRATT
jgi:hypothetical protein